MGDSKGTLNTLLNYRFVRKPANKLSRAESDQQIKLSRESSANSDSQATIPYNSQNSFKSVASDSQETLPYDSQSTISPSQVNGHCNNTNEQFSPSVHSTSSPVFKANRSSPVFKSNGIKVNTTSASPAKCQNNSTNENGSDETPWISKASGQVNHTAKSNMNFKRIKRPDPDSDSDGESDFGKGSGIKVDQTKLEKLKKMFPEGDVKRMKAALFAYEKDFDKAVGFMTSPQYNNAPTKRQHSTIDDHSDDLPAITGSRKRIKMMPQTPSPEKEMNFSFHNKDKNEDPVQFLKQCFPQASEERIENILKENDGDVEKSTVALANENSGDAQLAKSLEAKDGTSSKLTKTIKDQKAKTSSSKRRDEDMSDDDDDEYGDDYDSGDSEDSEDLGNKTTSEIDNFLQFFGEATVEELSAMPGCSKKKAELIITLRPFDSWDDLCQKFENTKPLSTSLISGCKEIMRVRNIIRRLMVRCENISQKMEAVVSTLTGSGQSKKGSQDLADEHRIVKQPDLLNHELSLKPYQLIGLSWLRIMHEQELNGILADEMGLGKTIQAIAFLAHLLEEGEEGPHVIIVPSSTIENWLRELQRWCPALKVIVYYGSQEERRAVRHSIFVDQEDFNVLLTTYNMATGGVEDRVLFKKFQFHYAIFDEGHMLKNMSSLRFQNLMKIVAERRLLLTGTPLQNNLLELMSLLCFVMPEIFQGKTESLKKMFTIISRTEERQKSRFEWDRIAQAKRIMKPFVLRRLKKDVLNQLPPKIEKILRCSLIESQRTMYDGLISHFAQEVEKGKDNASLARIGAFMQFRKAANHPLLIRHIFTDSILEQMSKKISKEPSHRDRGALPKLIQEDMSLMNDFELIGLCRQYKKYLNKFEPDPKVICDSGKFEKLDEILPPMKEKGDRILLFSQFTMMLDVMEHYLEQRHHKFIRLDGQTPVPDRLQLIDRFNSESDIFIFLLSTRAGGLGINLTAANTIIIHDIDFNPYNDKQAEDRCHRLGQTREVTVIRLIGEDTVDESMLICANNKLALEKDLTGPDAGEESGENRKDVANLLKDVLKQHQKRKEKGGLGGSTSVKSNGDGGASGSASSSRDRNGREDEVIEMWDDDEDSLSSGDRKKPLVNDKGLIEIGDEDSDDS